MNWKHIKIMWLIIILFHVSITVARAEGTDGLCAAIGDQASYIMSVRQAGVSAVDAGQYIDLNNITLYNMAVEAWSIKVFSKEYRKEQVIQSFGNVHEYQCLVYMEKHSL